MQSTEDSLVGHLLELRRRLIWILLVWLGSFFLGVPWARELYVWIATPLLSALPKGSHMITTQLVSSFMVPMKVTLVFSFVVVLPFTFYQAWAFVAPGLYQHERRLIFPLIVGAMLLFFIGMGFAYKIVAPLMFHFFSTYTTPGVTLMPDMESYLSLMLSLLMTFGFTFELPIVVMVLVRSGVVSREQLKAVRPYIILAAFIVAAILTPPDVLSQCLLAIPLCGLYELGLALSKWTLPPPIEEEMAGSSSVQTIVEERDSSGVYPVAQE
jgi:sec-independent protein translocase protein TatC